MDFFSNFKSKSAGLLTAAFYLPANTLQGLVTFAMDFMEAHELVNSPSAEMDAEFQEKLNQYVHKLRRYNPQLDEEARHRLAVSRIDVYQRECLDLGYEKTTYECLLHCMDYDLGELRPGEDGFDDDGPDGGIRIPTDLAMS